MTSSVYDFDSTSNTPPSSGYRSTPVRSDATNRRLQLSLSSAEEDVDEVSADDLNNL